MQRKGASSAEYTLADTPTVIQRGCWEFFPHSLQMEVPTDVPVIFFKLLFGYVRTESFIRVLEKTPRAGELPPRE